MFGVAHSFYYSVFIKSLGIGYILGLLYFLFMLPRRLGVRGRAAVILLDISFCLTAAVVSFLLLFDINAGRFRLYVAAGAGAGFLLFWAFPGKALSGAIGRRALRARRSVAAKLRAVRRSSPRIKRNKIQKKSKKTIARRKNNDI